MTTELRESGISAVGDVPWGTHFCHFYETKEDLLDILVPYFKTGLESSEFCMWVVADPLGEEEAREALRLAVPEAEQHLEAGRIEIVPHTLFLPPSRQETSPSDQIEIVPHTDWYLKGGAFIAGRVIEGWNKKLADALAKGFTGLRANGNEAWLTEENRKDFLQYEKTLDEELADQRIILLCSYPLADSGAAEIFDVVHSHQFALVRRRGNWEVVESPELKQAKTEIQSLNEELEQRVVERTRQLAKAIEELKYEIAERKQAEVELSSAHQRLSYHVENTPLAVIEWDKDLFIKRWSERAEEIFGWKASEALGINMYDPDFPIIYKEDKQTVEMIAARLMKGTLDRNVSVNRNCTKNGKVIYCEWYNSVLRDEQGNVITILSLVHDVTDGKLAEDALRRSEVRLRLVIDTIPTMAWSIRPNGTVDFLNRRLLEYTGLSFEEALEQPTGTVHPEDLPRVMEKWQAQMAAGEPFEAEMRLRRADGEYRWFLTRTEPLRDELGNLNRWYGVAIDIEDRRQTEEKLKQSESQLAEGQRLAHVGSWDWDIRSNSVTWSDEIYRIFGIQPGTIKVAGDAITFIHPEDRDLIFSTVKSAIGTREPYSFYYRILRPDGEERMVHSRGVFVSDENGNPIKAVGATQDVTELKRTEEELKVSSKQLRALSERLRRAKEEEGIRIARELHDELGSALTSLKWGLLGIDKAEFSTGKAASNAKAKIGEMVGLVDSTINTVRRISSELRPGVVDDLGLVSAIEWHAQQFHNNTGIMCDFESNAEDVEINREQATTVFRIFQEAMTNILRHAKATKVNILIEEEEEGEFVLEIKDNGRGITESEKLGTRSLGLLGMRERALSAGGKVEIGGVAGKGTVVTVRLPIQEVSKFKARSASIEKTPTDSSGRSPEEKS